MNILQQFVHKERVRLNDIVNAIVKEQKAWLRCDGPGPSFDAEFGFRPSSTYRSPKEGLIGDALVG